MKRILLLLLLLVPASVSAEPKDAVVRIPSHGGSGTVIATGPGWSFILSAAHMFDERHDPATPIVLDIPVPDRGKPSPIKPNVATRLLAVDPSRDAALLRLNYGPLPFVTPLAPRHFQPGECISVGYDEMLRTVTVRPAIIVTKNGNWEFTDRRPWHGRSGGALIDLKSGYLVGICSGYTGPRNNVEIDPGGGLGVYAELNSILDFLHQVKGVQIDEKTPPAPSPRPPSPTCPNGQCPRAPPAPAPWTPLPPTMIFGDPFAAPRSCPH